MTTTEVPETLMELPFRVFEVEVVSTTVLGPHFVRVTFAGDDLEDFADTGYDQRIKLVFPMAGGDLRNFPRTGDWYAGWRALPDDLRNPLRTYTVRDLRSVGTRYARLDVDFVLHGDEGPAGRWASRAGLGDRVLVVGPNARSTTFGGGIEFRPHSGARSVVLVGDETAVPAIAAILRRLPDNACGVAILEVPHPADRQSLVAPAGVDVRWLARTGGPGDAVAGEALRAVAARMGQAPHRGTPIPEPELFDDLVWEVPLGKDSRSPVYVWIAGESGVVTALRRRLVNELGVDRKAIAFMGYWKLGRAES